VWHAEWKAHSRDPLWGQARCSWGSTRLKRGTRWSEWGQYSVFSLSENREQGNMGLESLILGCEGHFLFVLS